MLSQIVKVKDKVEYLLVRYPLLRDDDNKLIAKIWYSETDTVTARDFLVSLGSGELCSSEAITRCRRKLQESNPELRGEKYNQRHRGAEDVRENMPVLDFKQSLNQSGNVGQGIIDALK